MYICTEIELLLEKYLATALKFLIFLGKSSSWL